MEENKGIRGMRFPSCTQGKDAECLLWRDGEGKLRTDAGGALGHAHRFGGIYEESSGAVLG